MKDKTIFSAGVKLKSSNFYFITIFSLMVMFFCNSFSNADIINVPQNFTTIQEAINVAVDRDTILVAPGTYIENINFSGKKIVIASHYILTQDSSLIDSTIIDGSNPASTNKASTVTFENGEDSTTVLQGFTVTGGKGTEWVDPKFPGYHWLGGGGIFMFQTSPTIINNIVKNNQANKKAGIDGAQGGGILCFEGNPLIRNNIITMNQAEYGAGLAIDYSGARIEYNIISKNSGCQTYGGGGIWTMGGGSAPKIITNNTIVENISETAGGGLYVWNSEIIAVNNIIWGNEQNSGGAVTEAGGIANVTYCDVEGGFPGAGNINIDPGFSDEDYHLAMDSPCIDTGDPGSALDPDGTRADIGAKSFYHLDEPYIKINNYEFDDSSGNNDGKLDPGESIDLVISLLNTSLDATNISAALTNDDPDIQITQNSYYYGNLIRNESGDNQDTPFSFNVAQYAILHFTTFYLNITADGGYTNTDSIKVLVGFPEALIVDDDLGASYEQYYIDPLGEQQIFPDIWDVTHNGCPNLTELQKYQYIIWFTGDDSISTITTDEQITIANYLDNGGKLFLTGQNIGFDLAGDGSESDSLFFTNYLHAEFHENNANSEMTIGVPNDPITHGMFAYLTENEYSACNQFSPDAISPLEPAELILKYIPGLKGAALRYADPISGSRFVYLSFGFEGIGGPQPTSAGDLLANITDWLQQTTVAVKDKKQFSPISSYQLKQNYPNPFNSSTTIRFSIPRRENVALKIFDINGKEVQTLVSKQLDSGNHYYNFEAKNLASGLYIYQLKAGNIIFSKKMLNIK